MKRSTNFAISAASPAVIWPFATASASAAIIAAALRSLGSAGDALIVFGRDGWLCETVGAITPK